MGDWSRSRPPPAHRLAPTVQFYSASSRQAGPRRTALCSASLYRSFKPIPRPRDHGGRCLSLRRRLRPGAFRVFLETGAPGRPRRSPGTLVDVVTGHSGNPAIGSSTWRRRPAAEGTSSGVLCRSDLAARASSAAAWPRVDHLAGLDLCGRLARSLQRDPL
jgi:hypothetical protein